MTATPAKETTGSLLKSTTKRDVTIVQHRQYAPIFSLLLKQVSSFDFGKSGIDRARERDCFSFSESHELSRLKRLSRREHIHRFGHPNIVEILNAFHTSNYRCSVMPLYDRDARADWIGGGNRQEISWFAWFICRPWDTSIHRDIKPGVKIFIGPFFAGNQPFLLHVNIQQNLAKDHRDGVYGSNAT